MFIIRSTFLVGGWGEALTARLKAPSHISSSKMTGARALLYNYSREIFPSLVTFRTPFPRTCMTCAQPLAETQQMLQTSLRNECRRTVIVCVRMLEKRLSQDKEASR